MWNSKGGVAKEGGGLHHRSWLRRSNREASSVLPVARDRHS